MQSLESQAIAALHLRGTRRTDRRVVLRGVDWALYERIDTLRGPESPKPRLIYMDGALEIMSPSSDHDIYKTVIARLLEAYAAVVGTSFNGAGSMTIRDEQVKRGLEPDECYF